MSGMVDVWKVEGDVMISGGVWSVVDIWKFEWRHGYIVG